MASEKAVATMLAYLHELFPTREITAATGEAWLIAFTDTPDDILLNAAYACARSGNRKFFPTAGEVRAMIPKADPAPLSSHEVLKQIERMGAYDMQSGWRWPRVEKVRETLGGVVAAAYGEVGPHRLNSDSPRTREIAERDFATALHAERLDREERPALTAPNPLRQLHD